MRPRAIPALIALCASHAALGFTACERFPADPQETTERVARERVLRVGVTEHRPWVQRGPDAEPSGVEVEIVRQLAASRGARVDWSWGQQERLLRKLEEFELDLVIGGIDERTPWQERVALTRPWYDPDAPGAGLPQAPLVFALPPGENRWLGVVERYLAAHEAALARRAAEALR